MHIQPEILCAAGVPGQLLDHGALDSRSHWDETSYGNDCGYGYSLSSPDIAARTVRKMKQFLREEPLYLCI